MAAKGRIPVKPRRTIAELEAELERQTAERNEALARESAIAEVLQVINSSPGDLSPVFDAILEKAHSLCDASFGGLLLFDGKYFRAGSTRGLPEQLAEFLSKPYSPEPGGPAARLIAGEPFYQITDQVELLARSMSPN